MSVSVKRETEPRVLQWEALRSWTTAPQPWTSGVAPPNQKAAGVAFGAGSADSSDPPRRDNRSSPPTYLAAGVNEACT